MDHRRKQVRLPKPPMFDWSKFEPSMAVDGHGPSLVEEMTTYRDRLPELLHHKGSYVVIKGQDFWIFPDRDTALDYSLKNYWPNPVLIKKIVDKQLYDSLGGATL